MRVLKCKPWGEDQGDHVLVAECDFDPEIHELVDPSDAPAHEGDAGDANTEKPAAKAKAKKKAD